MKIAIVAVSCIVAACVVNQIIKQAIIRAGEKSAKVTD